MAKMYPVQIKGQPNGFIFVEAGATAGGSGGGGGFSGAYADLTGKPILGTAAATSAAAYATAAQGTKADAAQVGILVKDESVDLGTSGTANVLDFVGAGVTATRAGNVVTVTIPGGGGGGGSGITRSVQSVAVNTAAGSTALVDYVYFVSGTTTLTLPTAIGNTNRYTVQNAGAGAVSIATTSSQTIHGSAAPVDVAIDNSLDLISDGANWRII